MVADRQHRLLPQFIDTDRGRLFALLHRPIAPVAGCVLVAPPFAEEMNKSRRMVTLLARELGAKGIATLLVDLHGTGDSDGDFAEADWQTWKSDLRHAAKWAEEQGCVVDRLLGIRLGCALAAEVARDLTPRVMRTVFWQPVLSGAKLVDQFLRLRVAAAMMELDRKETTAQLRDRLAAGESLEVAGYGLTGKFVAQLDAVKLENHLGEHLGAVAWIEIVRSAGAQPPVPSIKVVEAAQATTAISLHAVVGEPFWASVEIVTNQLLIDLSAEALVANREAAVPEARALRA